MSIRKIAFDDRTNAEIEGNIYRVSFEARNIEEEIVSDSECEQINENLLFDFSKETAIELMRLIVTFADKMKFDEIVNSAKRVGELEAEVEKLNSMLQPKLEVTTKKSKKEKDTVEEKYNSTDGVDLDKLANLYLAGWNIKKLSQEFFRSQAVIKQLLKHLEEIGKL